MNSYLCLGNAQALYLKKSKQDKSSPEILSRIAKQASTFFLTAFEASLCNPNLMKHNDGKFANVLGFWAMFYSA